MEISRIYSLESEVVR